MNSGHTIQVNYGPGSNGQAMEAHLVHQSEDGKLAAVAVFLKVGAEHPHMKKLWSAMAAEPEHENAATASKSIPEISCRPIVFTTHSRAL